MISPSCNRKQRLHRLATTDFDVLIIGGGINGAGTCLDLALQGLNVGLIEQHDFASGTSSASSKLAHGGIRYLQQGHLSLVRESCTERELLLRNAPHLVKPLPFLFPLYKDHRLKPWMLNFGLWMYDKLSGKLNQHPHHMLTKAEVEQLEPTLNTSDLTGCGLYYDAQMDDSRIVIELMIANQEQGAIVCNYVKCLAPQSQSSHNVIHSVQCEDMLTQETFTIRAKYIVNATGPWSDLTMATLFKLDKKRISPSRGSHIVVDALLNKHAVVLRSTDVKRIFFAIPWHSKTLIGTTDMPENRQPEACEISEEEIQFLLQQTNHFFPKAFLEKSQIISHFSGIRPLARKEGASLSAISREEAYLWHGNVLSIVGGKYTTYRHICENMSTLMCKKLNHTHISKTKHFPLPGAKTCSPQHQNTLFDTWKNKLETKSLERILTLYGSRAELVLKVASSEENGLKSIGNTPYIQGEYVYAKQYEFVETPQDFLRRRTTLALEYPHATL